MFTLKFYLLYDITLIFFVLASLSLDNTYKETDLFPSAIASSHSSLSYCKLAPAVWQVNKCILAFMQDWENCKRRFKWRTVLWYFILIIFQQDCFTIERLLRLNKSCITDIMWLYKTWKQFCGSFWLLTLFLSPLYFQF